MVCAHFAADYCFQPADVAREKNHNSTTELQKIVPWYYWLMSHCCTHGLAMYLVTGSVLICFMETVVHFAIDFAKCDGKTSLQTDQILHVLCKVCWCVILYGVS